jgi:hypothetical protein
MIHIKVSLDKEEIGKKRTDLTDVVRHGHQTGHLRLFSNYLSRSKTKAVEIY